MIQLNRCDGHENNIPIQRTAPGNLQNQLISLANDKRNTFQRVLHKYTFDFTLLTQVWTGVHFHFSDPVFIDRNAFLEIEVVGTCMRQHE